MKLLSITSPLLVSSVPLLELPDGRVMKYDPLTIRLDAESVRRHAFGVARDQIGVVQTNPDYATIAYCEPPVVRGRSWQQECMMTALEDVFFRDLVRPEFVPEFVEAFSELANTTK